MKIETEKLDNKKAILIIPAILFDWGCMELCVAWIFWEVIFRFKGNKRT